MKKKKGTRRRASVSGIKMQPVKGLLNLPTLGTAGVVAYGSGKMAADATGADYAMLRSKQGATQLAIAGTAGVLLIPSNTLLGKIARGAALGAMLHGVKVLATDEDWAGNAVVIDKTADVVAGFPYIPGQMSANGVGSRGRLRYAS